MWVHNGFRFHGNIYKKDKNDPSRTTYRPFFVPQSHVGWQRLQFLSNQIQGCVSHTTSCFIGTQESCDSVCFSERSGFQLPSKANNFEGGVWRVGCSMWCGLRYGASVLWCRTSCHVGRAAWCVVCTVRVWWLVARCHCCIRASKGIFAPLSCKLIDHKCLGRVNKGIEVARVTFKSVKQECRARRLSSCAIQECRTVRHVLCKHVLQAGHARVFGKRVRKVFAFRFVAAYEIFDTWRKCCVQVRKNVSEAASTFQGCHISWFRTSNLQQSWGAEVSKRERDYRKEWCVVDFCTRHACASVERHCSECTNSTNQAGISTSHYFSLEIYSSQHFSLGISTSEYFSLEISSEKETKPKLTLFS